MGPESEVATLRRPQARLRIGASALSLDGRALSPVTPARDIRPFLAAPVADARRHVAPPHEPGSPMAYLIVGGERVALQIGDNLLGGTGEDAVVAPGLAGRDPFARICVYLEVVTTISRIGMAEVGVDGVALGEAPRELVHGARIESEGQTIVFGDLRSIGTTAHVAGVSDDVIALANGVPEGDVAADTGGVLVAVAGGRRHDIPRDGLTIGRDPGCGLVLAGRDVSRVHAFVLPSLRGYTIEDRGLNGVFVGGARVDGSRLLHRGDVVRIGSEEFRFDADASSYEPAAARTEEGRKREVGRMSSGGTTLAAARPPVKAPAALLATLEVVTDGALRGTRFRIESALAHIGRGDHNTVRLPDGSVSGSHATLLHRGGAWHLADLGSTNGTYIDGERITGERPLSGAAELRVGDIRMVFRPIAAPAGPGKTRGIVGITDEQARKNRA